MIKINNFLEIFEKYIENKADWKVQISMHFKMCINWGQKGCLKSYWYKKNLTSKGFDKTEKKAKIYLEDSRY